MPRKKERHKCEPVTDHYVAVDGEKTNKGTIDSPWSLDYAAGGAGGCIKPGDTVWVCGGTYKAQIGGEFRITVSGTATDKITFKQYPGETVILDGSIPAFSVIGNSAWEPHEIRAGHNVYRSANTVDVGGATFYGGFIQITGEWYSLAPHINDAYISNDTHEWKAHPHPRYLGPGISQTPDGHIVIRLDNSTDGAQLGRPVPQISDPDPRNHSLYICSSRFFGFKITGSHLVIEDFTQINHFGGCFSMDPTRPGQTDVTIRNCGGRPIYFGIRCAYIDGLTLDSCKFYAHMPSDKWWVAYADIKVGDKPPADHVRKVGLALGVASRVEVVDCLFDEFFDGILASTKDDLVAHDIEIHHTAFNHIWDDTWQMIGRLYHINFHHNFCYGAGPSVDDPHENDNAGTVYIHHNVIDTTTRLIFRGRFGSPGAGIDEPSPLPSHLSSAEYSWPRKLYYNTIVTGQTCGGPDCGWALPKAEIQQGTHEVYNNIFLVADGRPGGREFDATNTHEFYDGNVYWCYFAFSDHVLSPWRLLTYFDEKRNKRTINLLNYNATGNVVTVDQLQEFLSQNNWPPDYPPDWEQAGLSEDPRLDKDYKPQNPSCQTGAVDLTLTTKDWPGTDSYEDWRGAIKP